ncbi:hypothetical protein BDW59DRAFT_140035 [Aspergillus cavernicola]|uniref:Uncharacterized protein n=1 Tax=Aspergillus cavernicola TaxID=176166 RepID=A0ABR4IVI9_9EURO
MNYSTDIESKPPRTRDETRPSLLNLDYASGLSRLTSKISSFTIDPGANLESTILMVSFSDLLVPGPWGGVRFVPDSISISMPPILLIWNNSSPFPACLLVGMVFYVVLVRELNLL